MMNQVCPECGGELIEDAWENIIEHEDSSMTVDAFSAYVCERKCGYYERADQEEGWPRVIAEQGPDRLLLLYPGEQGRIYELKDQVLFPLMNVHSLLARGYWEEYTGNHNIQALLQEARNYEDAFREPPNLFRFATSELSQDAFLCWLMSWAEPAFRSVDLPLHDTAQAFIRAIFTAHNQTMPDIKSITITRQFKSLDILTVINEKFAILIEDKTYTKDHSDQLMRYRKAVTEWNSKLVQLPIYYKIADQSHYRSCDIAGYFPLTRREMLALLENGVKSGVKNSILLDYYQHLQNLQNKVDAYLTQRVEKWDAFAWQGFYQELQREINGNWDYVNNRSGGFWGFWWGGNTNHPYHFQLEEQRLCVKLNVMPGQDRRAMRKDWLNRVLSTAKEKGLPLQRPAKLGNGDTMTIAVMTDYLEMNQHGLVDVGRTIDKLQAITVAFD
ncbi:hypothetical protein JOC78_002213 [Bacillus ectoiniformans]|uniref:PD-(D/E)XK nuclease family protein n=1 Tax=Bacillus ectoiniformans TaxID=1494429 RepID=UPI001959E58A|nr:PD-(D/E)XK nuclease family protein [Bacillus ectoiniformans]MBM7649260.1 hypothetical protein [Bacillus ectoiniformans]